MYSFFLLPHDVDVVISLHSLLNTVDIVGDPFDPVFAPISGPFNDVNDAIFGGFICDFIQY